MTGCRAYAGSDSGARRRGADYRSDIVLLVARTLDRALLPFQRAFVAGIEPAQVGAEITSHAVEQGKRIEAHLQFTASARASRLFHVDDCAGYPTPLRNHDAISGNDRECRFEVNAISNERLLRAHALHHVEQDVRAGLDLVLVGGRWLSAHFEAV